MASSRALQLTEAMLAAAVGDDWHGCAELAREQAHEIRKPVALDAATLARLAELNHVLLARVERQHAQAHEDLLALRRGSVAHSRYSQTRDG